MYRLFICIYLFSLLVTIPLGVGSQTISQRSEKFYSGLSTAEGTGQVSFLNKIVHLRLTDSIDRAEALARQAVRLSESRQNNPGLAESLISLGNVLIKQGKLDSAYQCYQRSEKIIIHLGGKKGMDEIYCNYGSILLGKRQLKKAMEAFNQGLKLGTENSNYPLVGRCYMGLADCYSHLNNDKEASANLDRAFASLLRKGDPFDKVPALMGLGIIYRDLGQYSKANKSCLKAIQNAEEIGDSTDLGYLYSTTAGFYENSTSPDKAAVYNLKALRIFRSTSNLRGMSYVMNNLGQFYIGQKDFDKAQNYFIESGKLKEQIADWQGAGFVHGNLAEMYIMTHNWKAAANELEKASEFSRKAGDGLIETVVLNTYGKFYAAQKQHTRARGYYEKSLQIAQKLKLHDFITTNLQAISEQYQAEGNSGKALEYIKKYAATRDSVFNASKEQNVAEIQSSYAADKQEKQQNGLLSMKMSASTRNSLLYGNLAVAGIIVALAFFFMFWYYGRIQFGGKPLLEFLSGVNNRLIPAENTERILVSDQATKPTLTPDQQKMIWEELNQLMSEEKLYLHSHLKLSELAGRLNTNTSYLSKAINDITDDNYCNYLNKLRIREAQKLLSDPMSHNLTIEAIAQSVGFNSKSAFNIAFKKYTSLTPSEFIALSQTKESILV